MRLIEAVSSDMPKSGFGAKRVGASSSPVVMEAVATIPSKNAQRGTLLFRSIHVAALVIIRAGLA
jgi:hypothetical protein